jgi:diguanylate cyclase (GGDEF)-like protein
VESRRLLDELKRTVDALQIFSEIGKTLTSTLDITEVLRIVLQRVSELLKPTSWSFLLLDAATQQLHYEILINEPSVDRNQTIPLGQSICGWVGQTGKAVLWPDLTPEKKHSLPPDLESPKGTKSMLVVPLRSKGKTLGVIDIRRKGDTALSFSVEDLDTLSAICDYAAIAIENARNFRRAQELTVTDDLTPLFNVRHMHTLLDAELLRSSRYKKEFSMIFLDLDHFKEVVDTYGHIHGSQLLKETAEVIRSHIRKVDYGARYGGDEFVVLLPETGKPQAREIAETLRNAIEQNVFLQDKGVQVRFTASFGVATFPDDAQTKDDLIRMADERMYEVKNTTRNRVAA